MNNIVDLRTEIGLSRKEFALHFGIPLRTVEDWEAGRRVPPEYIPRLIRYQIKFEKLSNKEVISNKTEEFPADRNVNIIRDLDGNKIVFVHDTIFKNKQNISWTDVERYLMRYIDEFYTIAEDNEKVYIGRDLPDEYAGSNYTAGLKGALAKAKANAAQAVPELIQIATNPSYVKNMDEKHRVDAKFGWYRYDSRFALAVYNRAGEIEKYNVFHVRMIIRHAKDGKKYLYDIINIKKERSTPSGQLPYG